MYQTRNKTKSHQRKTEKNKNQKHISRIIYDFLKKKKSHTKNIIHLKNWLLLVDYMFSKSKMKNTISFQKELTETLKNGFQKAVEFQTFYKNTKKENHKKHIFDEKIINELKKQLKNMYYNKTGGTSSYDGISSLMEFIFEGIFILCLHSLVLEHIGCTNTLDIHKKRIDYDTCDYFIAIQQWTMIVYLFRLGYLFLSKKICPESDLNTISFIFPELTDIETSQIIVQKVGTLASPYSGRITRSMHNQILPVATEVIPTNTILDPERVLYYPEEFFYDRIRGNKPDEQQRYEEWQNEQIQTYFYTNVVDSESSGGSKKKRFQY